MKTLTSMVLLGLSVGLLNQAVAEPFNNRGGEAITVLSAGADKPHQGAVIPLQGFNNQDVNGVVTFLQKLPELSPEDYQVMKQTIEVGEGHMHN